MGVLFSRFRTKLSTKELLEELQKEIDALQEYKRSTEVQQRTVIGSLIFYSVILYIIIAGVLLFYSFPVTTKDWIIYAIPFLIFPLLLYILKKFLQWYFLQKIKNNDETLLELRRKKKSLLEFAMETETFKVAKELLEKYDQAYHKRIFEPKAAIEASSVPLKGAFSELEVRRRNVSPRSAGFSLPNPGQTVTVNSSAGFRNIFPNYPGNPPTNPPYPPSFMQRGGPRFVRPPPPPMPRPVLPRDRTLFDKLVDYMVGDGPSNRYALICRQCQSHNGMALKEEFEFVAFRCCYCFQFNPPRNQQPPPPRLTLPAPPSAPPVVDAPPSEVSSSEETEVDSVSDIDITTSIQPVEEDKEAADDSKIEEQPSHRLSVSSDGEMQADLVEDVPYQLPTHTETEDTDTQNDTDKEGS